MDKIQAFTNEQLKSDVPSFGIGDGVKVYIRITDANNRHLCLHLLVCKSLNQVHKQTSFKIRIFMQSCAADYP